VTYNLDHKRDFYGNYKWSTPTLSATVVISINRITVDYYELDYDMDQLPSLMVTADMETADADHVQQQLQRQPQQSTAGRSAKVTRYRVLQQDEDDTESEEDEERPGAHYTMSTDMGPTTHEVSCSGGTVTTDERHQGDEFDPDGAGHRSGRYRCNPSEPEPWASTIHQYHAGLIGNGRTASGSSGRGSDADVDEGDRLQLAKIMCVPDRRARLQAIRRFLAESETADEDGVVEEDDHSTPDSPHLATNVGH